jgi:hypothetical protein
MGRKGAAEHENGSENKWMRNCSLFIAAAAALGMSMRLSWMALGEAKLMKRKIKVGQEVATAEREELQEQTNKSA